MDRFIELNALPNDIPITSLKSNMDRFIEYGQKAAFDCCKV